MTKKIPGSSLRLVVISFHLLFLVSLLLGVFLYLYGFVPPQPGQIPWTVNKFGIVPILLLYLSNISVFFIVVADILALKREHPRGAKQALLIVSLVVFGLIALLTLINLLSYLGLIAMRLIH